MDSSYDNKGGDADRFETNSTSELIEPKRNVTINTEIKTNLDGSFTPFLLFCVVTSVLGGSFQAGWYSGLFNTPQDVIQDFYKDVYLENYNKTMANSTMTVLWSVTDGLLSFTGIFAGMSSGFIADSLGRKNSLILSNVFVATAIVLGAMSKSIKSYVTVIVAHGFGGFYSGLVTGIIPIYLYEISPKNLCGLIGSMNQLSIVLGILVTNIVGLPQLLGTADLWPVLIGVGAIPILAHIVLIAGAKSPKYLYIKCNDREGAERELIKLRGTKSLELVQYELELLEEEKANLSKQRELEWFDFWEKKELYRPLVVTVVIQLSQQLCGINAVTFYSTSIFNNAGFKNPYDVYCTIMLGFIQVIMTVVCVVVVDRVGRKILLLIGMVGMCLSSFGLAALSTLALQYPDESYLNFLTVGFSVLYVIFFSIGPGAIPWIITSELFGSEARGKASSLATFVNWCANFLTTVSFPFIQAAFGSYSFILFGCVCIFFSLFMLFFVPETRGKSTDEIGEAFKERIVFLSF